MVQFPPVFCDPKPVQKSGPPILLGGHVPKALERVARTYDGWCPLAFDPADYKTKVESIRKMAKEFGRDPDALQMSAFVDPKDGALDHRVTTDADGRFVAVSMPTGSYTIHVVADKVGEVRSYGYRVTAGATSPSTTLRLVAHVTVRGTVDMKSFGIEGADYPTIVLEATGCWRQKKIDPDGSFVIRNVLPGKYSVTVNAAIGKKAVWVHGGGGLIDVGKQGAGGLKITKR